MRHYWSGIVAQEGIITGDGRVFVDGAFRWDPANLAAGELVFRWDIEDDGGHAGAVEIGRITQLEHRDAGQVWGAGWVDDEWDHGDEFVRRLGDAGSYGVSMDGDDYVVQVVDTTITEADGDTAGAGIPDARVAAAGDPDPGEEAGVVMFEAAAGDILERWLEVRVRSVTAVDIPAFNNCQIRLDPSAGEAAPDEPADDEGATPPPADPDGDAPGDEAATRLPAAAAAAGAPCCDACATRAAAQSVARTAAAGQSRFPIAPPREWMFYDPDLFAAYRNQIDAPEFGSLRIITEGPTAGRMYAYLSAFGVCHTGYHGECVTTPTSATQYAHFRTGYVVCADGTEVSTGPVTSGAGHADLALSYAGAIEHYDNVCTAVADVTAGEDEFGVWLAGALRPGVTDEQIRTLRASALSGDWRPVGTTLELVAALAINTPGYPIPRARVASGRVTALVAAGAPGVRRLARPRRSPEATRIDVLESLVVGQARRRLDAHAHEVRRRALARLTG